MVEKDTYVILSDGPNEKLGQIVDAKYEDHYDLRPDQMIVSTDETTIEISENLGIQEGDHGRAVVFRVNAYNGHHKQGLWEWLELD